jgi:hypothetical protein
MLRRHRPLGFESLERRDLLAGNINVSVSDDGQLRLTGDWQQNVGIVWKGVVEGRIVVSGGRDYVGLPTLINGQFFPQVFEGVTHIRADMYGPNTNRILFTNLDLPDVSNLGRRSIIAGMGHGDDQMVIASDIGRPLQFERNDGASVPYGDVNIRGSVYMVGGIGNDKLSIVNASVGTLHRFSGFEGGEGDDHFYVDGNIDKNRLRLLKYDMGSGNDRLTLRNADVREIMPVNRGGPFGVQGDSSTIDLFRVTMAGFNFDLANRVRTTISIDSHATTPSTIAFQDGRIRTGPGDASITINRTEFSGLDIRTGSGNDTVTIRDSRVNLGSSPRNLIVRLEEGDDVLRLRNVEVTRSAFLDGGEGHDRYFDEGGNSFGELTVSRFEE